MNPSLKNTYRQKNTHLEGNSNTLQSRGSLHGLQSIISKSMNNFDRKDFFGNGDNSLRDLQKAKLDLQILGNNLALDKKSQKEQAKKDKQARLKQKARTERYIKSNNDQGNFRNITHETEVSEESDSDIKPAGIHKIHFSTKIPNLVEYNKRLNLNSDELAQKNLTSRYNKQSYSSRQYNNNVFYKKNLENYTEVKKPSLNTPMQTNDKKWLVCSKQNLNHYTDSNSSIPFIKNYHGVDKKEEILEKINIKKHANYFE